MTERELEIDDLYDALAEATRPEEGPVPLSDCQPPAASGVYMFFEAGEVRRNGRPRIVRVGESGNLRNRLLLCHLRGTHRDDRRDAKGRLRSSVFRKHVGVALRARDSVSCPTWGSTEEPRQSGWRAAEDQLERHVTNTIAAMSVAWLLKNGRDERKGLEREMIRLLSNYRREAVDSPSANWLGRFHRDDRIRDSGLWNKEHVV